MTFLTLVTGYSEYNFLVFIDGRKNHHHVARRKVVLYTAYMKRDISFARKTVSYAFSGTLVQTAYTVFFSTCTGIDHPIGQSRNRMSVNCRSILYVNQPE